MGSVYRKSYTKPVPAGAEFFTRKGQRWARWKDSKGKTRTAEVTTGTAGVLRITIESPVFVAKYRDGRGTIVEKTTGCRDADAARSVLREFERRAVLVKSILLSSAEAEISDQQPYPLVEHFDAYGAYQTAKGLNAVRIKNTASRLKRLARECGFHKLADLKADALEQWLADRVSEGMSAGNRNEFRQELIGFGNWCVRTRRMLSNPFLGVPKADAKADQRRKRRSLTETELANLLDVARRRPLLDAMKVRRGADRDKPVAKLRPETVARLKLLGHERALIYKTLALTGLRRNELRSLTVGQLCLVGEYPHAVLEAADEKNREGSTIPLRGDLADDLRKWIDLKRERLCGAAGNASDGQDSPTISIDRKPADLPADTPVFTVPSGLVRILDRDLVLAGIARQVEVNGKKKIDKRDERGRTIDVHALRHTFGTLLSKGGVAPRTAQAAMRHSTIDLTMNVYTDPKLLDVHAALDALPVLPLDAAAPSIERATGTDGQGALAPPLAPTSGRSGASASFPVKTAPVNRSAGEGRALDATRSAGKRNNPLTTAVSGCREVERKGVEPSTSALRTQRSPN